MALDPISAALDIGGKVIDRLWPDPAQRAAAQLELLKLQQSGELAQIAVNQSEAQTGSLFIGGWRPFIGWTCGVACAWNWLGLPVALFVAAAVGHPIPGLAPAGLSEMWPVLLGMLGLGSLRTFEKTQGVARV